MAKRIIDLCNQPHKAYTIAINLKIGQKMKLINAIIAQHLS
jgi:hypothetical protein